MALISKGVCVDFVGGDEVDSPELHGTPKVNFFNLRGKLRRDAGLAVGEVLAEKAVRVLIYYGRLIRYAAVATPKVFHVLWNNRFECFEAANPVNALLQTPGEKGRTHRAQC